jgi:SAM-dependent methyltransferase
LKERRIIPYASWDELHRRTRAENQAWFYDSNDDDLERWLTRNARGRLRILEVGSGSGVQSIAMALDGHEVTGTDISETAVKDSQRRAGDRGAPCRFLVDDILDTALKQRFDLIFDRGCFHCFGPDERAVYAKAVAGLLDPDGSVLIKCLSEKEPDGWGPYRISSDVIHDTFRDFFRIVAVEETVYQGRFYNLKGRHPAAYFVELKLIEPPPT